MTKPSSGSDDLLVVVEDDYQPNDSPQKLAKQGRVPVAPTARPSSTSIALHDGKDILLDDLDPRINRDIRNRAQQLAKGVDAGALSHENGDLFVLLRRNGLYLALFLVQCVILIAICGSIVYSVTRVSARGIPSTKQVEGYKRADAEMSAIEHFAEMASTRMESWNYWNARQNPKRVMPLMVPGIRETYDAKFQLNIRNADRYQERQLFEPVRVAHMGIDRETTHKVNVFYQQIAGRGKDERNFSVDRQTRRVKILRIVEGQVTDENRYGFYVLNHSDYSEREFMDAILAKDPNADNPWDKSMGIMTPKKAQAQ